MGKKLIMKKVLNLYAGIGGNRKLWGCEYEVTAIEYDPKIAAVYQKLYPDDAVVVADAHEYLREHYEEFDIIWSSPPCQKNSRMVKATRHKTRHFPDLRLYEEVIFLQNFFKGIWVIENVKPYYKPLIEPTSASGRHFFWSNVAFEVEEEKSPKNFIQTSNLKGKENLMNWLGIHFEEKLYYQGNHCPCQVLRNCVHPNVGKKIMEALDISQTTKQQKLIQ